MATPTSHSAITLPRPGGSLVPWLIVALFASQGFQFWFHISRNEGAYLLGDNTFYETPAWRLANGQGFTIPTSAWEDPGLTSRYLERHPGADASSIPAATFPPGYGWYLAGVYYLFGHSHKAAVWANGPPLAFTLAIFVLLVRRSLRGEAAQAIALTLGVLFPSWGFWAARIMSDTVCNAFVVAATALWLIGRPTFARTVLIGLSLGGAMLVRPYAALLPGSLVILLFVLRADRDELKRAILITAISCSCLGIWALRNYYHFGLPTVASMGLGFNLWQATVEAEDGRFSNFTEEQLWSKVSATGAPNPHTIEGDRRFREIAIARIAANPVRAVKNSVIAIPRLWITQGNRFAAPVRVLLGLLFGSIFALMLVGVWTAAKTGNRYLVGMAFVVAYYTVVFLPVHIESRYTLPARPMGLILAAAGAEWFLIKLRGRPLA